MQIWILDDSLRISIFFDKEDCGFNDNICVSIYESCPDDEKIMIADETNIFLTSNQALQLSQALKTAAVHSKKNKEEVSGDAGGYS